MSNKCPTCSQTGAERSNPQGEARCGEPASRNESELDSASLRYTGAANLPEMAKPATVGEATLERILAEENGVEKFLAALHEELKTKSYRPSPVKRVYLPQPQGRENGSR